MSEIRIWYEGRDITDRAQVSGLTIVDRYGSIPDETELELWDEHGIWGEWDPRPGERLRVVAGGFDTGTLRIDNPVLEGRRCTLRGISSAPSVRTESWGVMQEISLTEIARRCSRETGLALKTYGLAGDPRYERVARGHKTPLCFLTERCDMEGVAVKVDDGRLLLVGWDWAAGQEPAARLDLGAEYVAADWQAWDLTAGLGLLCGGAEARAGSAGQGRQALRDDIAFYGLGEGMRFARNLLADKNRQERQIRKSLPFTPGIAALSAVQVEGGSAVAGVWIAAQVVHRPIADVTELTLVRGDAG